MTKRKRTIIPLNREPINREPLNPSPPTFRLQNRNTGAILVSNLAKYFANGMAFPFPEQHSTR